MSVQVDGLDDEAAHRIDLNATSPPARPPAPPQASVAVIGTPEGDHKLSKVYIVYV